MTTRKTWLATLSGAIITGSLLGSIMLTNAQEAFTETIQLDQGVGQVFHQDLGIGDNITLTLVNPTNEALLFETRYPLIGDTRSWVIPAGETRTVSFVYSQPFNDDLTYTVRSQQTGQLISQGTVVDRDNMEGAPATTTGAAAPQQQPYQSQAVRGYW